MLNRRNDRIDYKKLGDFEEDILKNIPNISINDLELGPYNFENIVHLIRFGHKNIFYSFDMSIAQLLLEKSQLRAFYVTFSLSIILIVFSIIFPLFSNYSLFYSFISSLSAFILSTDTIMKRGKGIGGVILFFTLIYIVISLFTSSLQTYYAAMFFLILYLLTVSKEFVYSLYDKIFWLSEPVFCYLVMTGRFKLY